MAHGPSTGAVRGSSSFRVHQGSFNTSGIHVKAKLRIFWTGAQDSDLEML